MKKKVLIVVSDYYKDISEALLKSTKKFLNKKTDLKIIKVPDVFEIPVIISRNINTFHAAIDPNLVKDKKNFLIKLRLNFPDLPFNEIQEKLDKKKYFRLKKRIDQIEKDKFWSSLESFCFNL